MTFKGNLTGRAIFVFTERIDTMDNSDGFQSDINCNDW